MDLLEAAINAIEDLVSSDIFEYGSDEDRELNLILSILLERAEKEDLK